MSFRGAEVPTQLSVVLLLYISIIAPVDLINHQRQSVEMEEQVDKLVKKTWGAHYPSTSMHASCSYSTSMHASCSYLTTTIHRKVPAHTSLQTPPNSRLRHPRVR